MTRAAREQRAAEAARRAEQVWAAQAYLSLRGLWDDPSVPMTPATRAALGKFLREAPPTITMAAAAVSAVAQHEGSKDVGEVAGRVIAATRPADEEPPTIDVHTRQGRQGPG